MSKQKNVETEKQVEVEKPKEAPKPVIRKEKFVCKMFREVAQEGAKDRKELAEKILKKMNVAGITKKVNNSELSVSTILKQISGLRQNIVHQTGGWKNNYRWEEDEKHVKIVEKKALNEA